MDSQQRISLNIMFPITSIFAALLALYFVRLAFAVIRLRRGNKVALGAGGIADLEGAIRAHGNFAEYVPLGLILMALLEANNGHPALLLAIGSGLTVGRVLHATALGRGDLKLRVKGMKLTIATLIATSVLNVCYALLALV